MQRNLLIAIFFPLILVCCKESHTCLTKYDKQSEFTKRLFIEIDTTLEPNEDCKYNAVTSIPLADSSYSDNSLFYLEDDKFYMRLKNPTSEDFIIFDMGLPMPQAYKIEIHYQDTVMRFDGRFEKKLITHDNLEVRVFRIKNLFCYYPDDFCSPLDVVFFVTKDHGVIGSYLSGFENNGQEILIAPAGDIFKEYLDYSKIKLRYLM
jgi:hypothetical protein